MILFITVLFSDLIQSDSGKDVSKPGKSDKHAGKQSPTKGKGTGGGGTSQKKTHEESLKTESKLKKRSDADTDVFLISK